MSAAERNRGARCEVQVVNYLRSVGFPDARRYLAGDGKQPGDIDFAPGIHLEVKDRADSRWPSWRSQAVAECGERTPIVLRRTRGVRDVGQWTANILLASLEAVDLPPLDDHRVFLCKRTDRVWVELTFEDALMALTLEPVVLDGAR